jgi:hypothetical protein
LKRAAPGLRLNEHIEADGPSVFAHACKMGLEGIVSKRKDSRYRSGRSPDWLKSKNPACEAVRREEEEDWGPMKLANPPGAQFEILVDGKPRSYRDIKAVAIASAEFLKSKNPQSEVAVKDLQSGEVTVVTRGWDR